MGKIAFIFAGQGAQYPGMMKEMYDSIPESREIFNKADEILDRDITRLCFEGPQESLNLTENTQPCVYTADMAAYAAILSHGINAEGFAGFSLGEYAALTAAGFISFGDCLRVVQTRAKAMQAAVPVGIGAMVVTGTKDRDLLNKTISDVASGYLAAANYNSPEQVVLSGTVEAVDEFISLALQRKIKAMKLAVSAPFHCELMRPAASSIDEALSNLELFDTISPIYMNVDGNPQKKSDRIVENIKIQVYSPLQWHRTIENMILDGYDLFVELGPGKALTGFNKKISSGITTLRFGTMAELEEVVRSLKKKG